MSRSESTRTFLVVWDMYGLENASFASFSSSCTQLFDLIGSKAMISEPAATTMAIAA